MKDDVPVAERSEDEWVVTENDSSTASDGSSVSQDVDLEVGHPRNPGFRLSSTTRYIGNIRILGVRKNGSLLVLGPQWLFSVVLLVIKLVVALSFLSIIKRAQAWNLHYFFGLLAVVIPIITFCFTVVHDPGILLLDERAFPSFVSQSSGHVLPCRGVKSRLYGQYHQAAAAAETQRSIKDSSADSSAESSARALALHKGSIEMATAQVESGSAITASEQLRLGIASAVENLELLPSRSSRASLTQTLPCTEFRKLQNGEMYCVACRFVVPEDAFHCLECNVCIKGYHHHCPWTSKCIGEDNLTLFYVWVISSFIAVAYLGISGAILCDMSDNVSPSDLLKKID